MIFSSCNVSQPSSFPIQDLGPGNGGVKDKKKRKRKFERKCRLGRQIRCVFYTFSFYFYLYSIRLKIVRTNDSVYFYYI